MDAGLWHCTRGSDQDHPQEKEAVQTAEKGREAKGKGEKER